jgi:hypothetical protein
VARANYKHYYLRARASPRPALTKSPPVRRLRSLPFMANSRRKRSAHKAQVPSNTVAMARKVPDSSVSCLISSALGLTNCGRNAPKNSSVLGLVRETKN